MPSAVKRGIVVASSQKDAFPLCRDGRRLGGALVPLFWDAQARAFDQACRPALDTDAAIELTDALLASSTEGMVKALRAAGVAVDVQVEEGTGEAVVTVGEGEGAPHAYVADAGVDRALAEAALIVMTTTAPVLNNGGPTLVDVYAGGVEDARRAYGPASPQHATAMALVLAAVHSAPAAAASASPLSPSSGTIAALAVTPAFGAARTDASRTLASDASTEASRHLSSSGSNGNATSPYTIYEIYDYQLFVWTGVAFIFLMASVLYVTGAMSFPHDPVLSTSFKSSMDIKRD